MSSPAPRLAAYILDDVVKEITTFVDDQSANMISVIGPAASLCMTAYVLLWGAGVATGRSNEPFVDGARRIIKMCAVVILGLSSGVYQGTVTSFFLTAPDAVAAAVSGNLGSGAIGDCAVVGDGESARMSVPIDRALCMGMRVGQKAWTQAKATSGWAESFGYIVLAGLIYISIGLVCAAAVTTVFMAFVCMAILLAIGPIFIFALLFEPTKRFFELWLGQILNFCILFVLVGCVMTLSFSMFNKYLDQIMTGEWVDLIVNTVKVIVSSLTVASILIQSRALASSLAGGIALQGQNVAGKLASGAQSTIGGVRAVGAGVAAIGRGGRATAPAASNRVPATVGMARRTFGQ
jgi:type IV secretion system protein VirB6